MITEKRNDNVFSIRSCLPIRLSWMILLLLSLSSATSAQIRFSFDTTFQLVADVENVIQNSSHLYDVYESLYQQKRFDDRKVSIVHIGDSHIQGDYMTTILRRSFQKEFGNAGRGLVVPFRVAGTNEPQNFISHSKSKWNSKRIVHKDNPLPIGIGAVTIESTQPADFSLFMNDLWMDYSFSTVNIFYKKDKSSFRFLIQDSSATEIGLVNSVEDRPAINFSSIKLSQPVTAITVRTLKTDPAQNHATIFGLSLENGRNGVLYHTIGVNGAKYAHYNLNSEFFQQTGFLMPQLFIISIGSNEAIDYPLLDKNFESHIMELLGKLQRVNPLAKFLLVTPPVGFRKKTKSNPGLEQIREQIVSIAVENGLAFYDLYKIMGSESGTARWKDTGLLRSDGIHFTKAGYEYIGSLFYHALIKSYNNYVSLRHP
jgi:lysophospholipase L1-like esterase